MERHSAVVGLGTVVVDHLMRVERYPACDDKVAAGGDHLQIGGPVPTALVQLRRLGHPCAFIGCWGDDPFGAMIETDLASEGIDLDASLRIAGERSGVAQGWVSSGGERTIVHRRMDAARFTWPAAADALLAKCRALHLDGWPPELALRAARMAKRGGALVSLDVGSPKAGLEDLLACCDIVNCPRRHLLAVSGEEDVATGIAAIQAHGPRWVAVTDGVAGASLACDEHQVSAPALQIDAVDSCGAGDIFCGALLHGILAGHSPTRALALAQAAAARSCTRFGNRAGIGDEQAIAGMSSV